jgi:ABC-type glycerol-3-phosphate transport system permease component
MIGPGGVEVRADTRIAHESGRSASVLRDRACAHLDADAETVRRGVSTLVGRIDTDWAAMTAAGVLAALPIVVFALLVQRHLVRGLTMGAVK